MNVKIVKYDRSNEVTFEEQINEVIEELVESNNRIIDVKVIDEKKVLILYKNNMFQ